MYVQKRGSATRVCADHNNKTQHYTTQHNTHRTRCRAARRGPRRHVVAGKSRALCVASAARMATKTRCCECRTAAAVAAPRPRRGAKRGADAITNSGAQPTSPQGTTAPTRVRRERKAKTKAKQSIQRTAAGQDDLLIQYLYAHAADKRLVAEATAQLNKVAKAPKLRYAACVGSMYMHAVMCRYDLRSSCARGCAHRSS